VFVRLGASGDQDPAQSFRLTILFYDNPPPLPLVDPLDQANGTDPNRREPTVVEDFGGVDSQPLGPDDLPVRVNGASRLVRVRWTEATVPESRPAEGGFTPLAGGADAAEPGAEHYIGTEIPTAGPRSGLAGLEVIEEISLLCVPDEVHPALSVADRDRLRRAVLDQCAGRGDRFAILSVPGGPIDVATIGPPAESSLAAVYHPWVRVAVPGRADTVLVPPTGHVAGIYARTDLERGVHKAPANEVVRGIVDGDPGTGEGPLEFPVSRAQNDALNSRRINVIRDFRAVGRDVRVWGARTLSAEPSGGS
jgi:hypothetical protein